eukprot:TRINITY_DN504_c0_g1_i20.p1 TRINITY_DN504_c0_g1~~TRINITY_DN504_c0_g1_i20.p1  ORF type:complete len:213 (+),score=15.81 TRINITY_DN504_c0_g1_i20:779-1417(+)
MKPKSSPSPDSLQACIYQLDPESFATFLLPTFQEILTSHTQIEEFAKSVSTKYVQFPSVMLTTKSSPRFSAIDSRKYQMRLLLLLKHRLREHVLLLDLLIKHHPKHFFLMVDFSKAFDSIAHKYLLDMLVVIQFPSQFIYAIKNLTFQVNTNILVNESISDIKIPVGHGSRQGDPISGYLINIALDVLNTLILQSLQQSIIHINPHSVPHVL